MCVHAMQANPPDFGFSMSIKPATGITSSRIQLIVVVPEDKLSQWRMDMDAQRGIAVVGVFAERCGMARLLGAGAQSLPQG
jgi:hypothetical protein